jgi:hypothetical protein
VDRDTELALEDQEPITIREEGTEFHDLGFIIEDRIDTRERLLARLQSAEDPEGDEPADAEAEESEFARSSGLTLDPDEELDLTAEAEKLRVEGLEWGPLRGPVELRSGAPGIAPGFGTALPQDIGPSGFSVRKFRRPRRR